MSLRSFEGHSKSGEHQTEVTTDWTGEEVSRRWSGEVGVGIINQGKGKPENLTNCTDCRVIII